MDQNRLDALETEWASAPEIEPKLPRRLPLKSVALLPRAFQSRSDFNLKTGVTAGGKQHVATMAAFLRRSKANDLVQCFILEGT
jgi:hypothetical protein